MPPARVHKGELAGYLRPVVDSEGEAFYSAQGSEVCHDAVFPEEGKKRWDGEGRDWCGPNVGAADYLTELIDPSGETTQTA